jgi:two-component system, cell cycle response regulator
MYPPNTILIVDDEPLGRETLTALLEPQGYQLRFAGSGSDALALAAAQPPDLILLDVMMPGMDGFEVCRRLRADALLREVPVIMLTALDDRVSRLQGIEAGADDFISKPFDRVELRARVRTITRLNRYRRLLAERARFEWVVEQAEDGYLIVGEAGNVLYANPQAQIYLGSAPGAYETDETFLDLAGKQYRCEPVVNWAAWTAEVTAGAPAPRYLVRPPSSNAEQFMLHADLIEMAPGANERYLVRLRDITATIVNQNAVWSFQGLVRHKLSTALSQVVGALRLIETMQKSHGEGLDDELLQIAMSGAGSLQEQLQAIFRYVDAPDIIGAEPGRCRLDELPAMLSEIGTSMELPAISVVSGIDEADGEVQLGLARQGVMLILSELIANARKFHPQQLPTIEVVLKRADDAVQITFCDDGQTLSPEQLAKAWLPYFQGERFFTGQLGGMGLGLPMVAALLWRIGGTCRIYNRDPGPGVGVELVVPLVENSSEPLSELVDNRSTDVVSNCL